MESSFVKCKFFCCIFVSERGYVISVKPLVLGISIIKEARYS
jgi:hypothetical protein